MARTVSSNLNGGITVTSSNSQYNPLYVNPGVIIAATGSYAIAGKSSILLTIFNDGTVESSKAGVYLGRTLDTITNSGTASHIEGATDGILAGAAPIITNQGTITGAGAGIYLKAGGTITNSGTAALIGTDGGNYGVRVIAGAGFVTNQGTIYSTNGAGVDFLAGGSMTNSGAASLVRGKAWGMYFGAGGGVVSVTNQGTIRGTAGPGIRFGDGGVVNNSAGALIYGISQGVSDYNIAATIVNQGRIVGETLSGMYLKAGGAVTNSGTAALISGKYWGLYFKTGGAYVLNQGTIKSTVLTGSTGYGIWFVGGGRLENSGANSWIYGLDNGVNGVSGATTIINQGLIQGGLGNGVVLSAGGYVWNRVGGHIYGETEYGIQALNSPISVTNQGIIKGINGWAIDLSDGGTVTNVGTTAWIDGGIEFGGASAGTVIDGGIINGFGGDAVAFANAADNLLALYTGASVTGTLVAGTGSGNKLDLNSGSAIGTLSSGFSGFQTLDVESGARWSLSGNGTLKAASTLSLAASSSLTITGSLVALGALTLAGSGNLVLSGAGDIQVGTGSAVTAGQLLIDSGQTLVTTGTVSLSNVKNLGVVSGTSSYGLYLGDGGTVINATGARITGSSGGIKAAGNTTNVTNQGSGFISGSSNGVIVENTAAGNITNQGTITGGIGVDLKGGGTVSNQGTGIISGSVDGVYSGDVATVTNQATITGNIGVVFDGGGFVTNSATTSEITGSSAGVWDAFGGAVVNHGIITATNGVGVTLLNGGIVTNSGTIGGTTDAVQFAAGASGIVAMYPSAVFLGTVNGGNTIGGAVISELELMASANAVGTLNGLGTQFINFSYITVSSGATWTIPGTVGSGVTFTNSGTLPGGVTLAGGAILTNTSGGTIGSSSVTIAVYGLGTASVVNDGRIIGGGLGAGIKLLGASTVTNLGSIGGQIFYGISLQAGGRVTNSGTASLIAGENDGVAITGGAGSVFNAGTVTGTSLYGVLLADGGSVTNSGTAALISSHDGVKVSGGAGSVFNQGTIAGLLAVFLGDGGTVTNAGTINGEGHVAVQFATGVGGRLVVQPSAAFVGQVNGGYTIGATAASVLELASAAGAGTLNSLGSQFTGFSTITIDSGANWTLGGSVVAGTTLENDGNLGAVTLAPGGVLINQSNGEIASPGTRPNVFGVVGLAGSGPNLPVTSITNAGHIFGEYGGIYLYAGGAITNQNQIVAEEGIGIRLFNAGGSVTNSGTGASILGNTTGIAIYAGAGTISNDGKIMGLGGEGATVSEGIYLQQGGSVTNTGTASTIHGFIYGIANLEDALAVTNAGTISAVRRDAIYSEIGNLSVTNQGTASVIAGSEFGVYVPYAAATIINQGLISAANGDAVALAAGFANRLIVDPGASFSGTVDGAHTASSGRGTGSAVSTLELAPGTTTGLVVGFGSKYIGFADVTIDSGAYWELLGTLGSGQTLENAGTLISGLTLLAGANLINAAGATLTGKTFFNFPVHATGAATVTNAGSLYGDTTGVDLLAGGVVINQASGWIGGFIEAVFEQQGATVINSGTLSASFQTGVYLYKGGSLTNFSGGVISGAYGGVYGTNGAATVVNAGTIAGGGGDAVRFAAGFANRLVIDPGAVFSGLVDGAYIPSGGSSVGTAVSTLELASGSAIGTLSGLGSNYIGFGPVTIDPGASWVFSTAETLTAGAYLTENGTLLLRGGTLTGAGQATIGDLSDNAAAMTVSGTGAIFNVATNLLVGRIGDGALDVSGGGTVIAGVLEAGALAYFNTTTGTDTPLGDGAVTVDGSGSALTTLGEMLIGVGGVGNMTIENGARAIAAVDLGATPGAIIAESASSDGSFVNVTGADSKWIVDFGLVVGDAGTGALNITAGGTVLASSLDAASGQTGGAVLSLSGTSSVLTVTGTATLGDAGSASMSVFSGAAMTAGVLNIAGQSGSTGGLTLSGSASSVGTTGSLIVGVAGAGELSVLNGASLNVGATLVIGEAGSGQLSIAQGGTVDAAALDTAAQAASSGDIVISGASSQLNVTGDFIVGDTSNADLAISGGTITAGNFDIGLNAGASGVVDMEGGSTLDVAGAVNVGDDGNAVLSLGGDATVNSTSFNIGTAGVLIEFGDPINTGTFTNSNSIVVSGTFNTTTATAEFINNGLIVVKNSGTEDIVTPLMTGTVGVSQLSSNGELLLNATTVTSSQTIIFEDATGTLDLGLGDVAGFHGTIAAYTPGDKIIVNTTASVTFSLSGLDIDVVQNGVTIGALTFDNTGNASAAFNTSGAVVDNVVCFCKGTLIGTPEGDVPVETLQAGDRVRTLSGAARRIIWIGSGRVLATRGRRSAATPVIVRKGALGDNVPHHDLHVTKGHSMFVDGVLVPVEFLVNHRTILWDDRAQEVTIYHVELETHDVLLANGAAAESYRDDGNRWLFQTPNQGWHLPPQPPCAPVLTGGAVVDAIWLRLMERAGPRRGVPLTGDPDLHLVVDGTRVDAMERGDDRYAFRLAKRPGQVRLVSRSAVPQELGFARDARLLGVAVRQIVLAQPKRTRTIDADAAALADGFYAFEADAGVREADSGIRWTDGDAGVPDALFVGMERAAMLVVRLGGGTMYVDEGAIGRVALI